jgi:predicted DNA-binding transcriptional regulator AlpA
MDNNQSFQLIGMPELTKKLGYSRTTILRLMDAGKMPPSMKITNRSQRWRLDVIDDWIKAGCPANWQDVGKENSN